MIMIIRIIVMFVIRGGGRVQGRGAGIQLNIICICVCIYIYYAYYELSNDIHNYYT